MTIDQLSEALEELSSAEEFLGYFEIEFDPRVVQVNRLHILQRFHNNLASTPLPEGSDPVDHYRSCLQRAYQSFVDSSAQEQKVLRVFQKAEPGFVSLDEFH